MKKIFFENDKNLYKANLHCHTTVSDGIRTPSEIKAAYTEKGYSIVAFTDHHMLKPHEYLNDEGFLAINALEVECYDKDSPKTYHLNLYATDPALTTPPLPAMDYRDYAAVNRYIAERNAEGFLVCYNHPRWSLQTFEEYSLLEGCFAMEIYNHNCEVSDGLCGYAPFVYDEMLRYGKGGNLFCVAVDDCHVEADFFGGVTYVNSAGLGYADVMAALRAGDFYCGKGDGARILEISLDGDELTVKCSPCRRVAVYTAGRKCYVKEGDGLTEVKFRTAGAADGYFRVVCLDELGNEACSNAYLLNIP